MVLWEVISAKTTTNLNTISLRLGERAGIKIWDFPQSTINKRMLKSNLTTAWECVCHMYSKMT